MAEKKKKPDYDLAFTHLQNHQNISAHNLFMDLAEKHKKTDSIRAGLLYILAGECKSRQNKDNRDESLQAGKLFLNFAKKENNYKIKIFDSTFSSLLKDDIEQQILSPLSCLREFGDYWLLEFDLPLVNKKDIKITFDNNTISVEAKLKETYSEEKFGVTTKFEYFKKTISLPNNINSKKTIAKFTNGRLTITIPKGISGQKIKIK